MSERENMSKDKGGGPLSGPQKVPGSPQGDPYSEALALARAFLRHLGLTREAEWLDKINVYWIEVPNAQLYANYYNLNDGGFCAPSNPFNQCGIDTVMLELAGQTGYHPDYYLHKCDILDEEGCRIIRQLEQKLNELAKWQLQELYARIRAALAGASKAAIITENNIDWDVLALIDNEEKERALNELEKLMQDYNEIYKQLEEQGRNNELEQLEDAYYNDPKQLEQLTKEYKLT